MKRLIIYLGALALVLAACGGGGGDSGSDGVADPGPPLAADAGNGEDIFKASCAACHAQDATGITGLGTDMHNNAFIGGLSDGELVAFLQEGRPSDHPDNASGIAMPPKGGNPSLSDDDLSDVAAYLRTLQ